MTQPASALVQEFSQVAVLVHRSAQPAVQPVIRHDCVLLQVRVQLPPGQSSVQPDPETLLHRKVQPPPSQRCAHPEMELQSRAHPLAAQVCSQRVAELHPSEQVPPQRWVQVPVPQAQAPPSQVTAPVVEVTGDEALPHATTLHPRLSTKRYARIPASSRRGAARQPHPCEIVSRWRRLDHGQVRRGAGVS